MGIENEVLEIARRILIADNLEIDSVRDEVEGWDSLKHAEILITFEEVFDVQFTSEELSSISSLRDLINLLQNYGK